MKKIVVLFVLISIFFTSGCKTIDGKPGVLTPYDTGRDITVVYLLAEDNLNEEHVLAIKTLYTVFSEVMDRLETYDTDQEFDIPKFIKETLESRIENKKVLILAIHLADRYLNQLDIKFDFKELGLDDQIKYLMEFRRGIESAITDYSN